MGRRRPTLRSAMERLQAFFFIFIIRQAFFKHQRERSEREIRECARTSGASEREERGARASERASERDRYTYR
jgi:hypothetical protein